MDTSHAHSVSPVRQQHQVGSCLSRPFPIHTSITRIERPKYFFLRFREHSRSEHCSTQQSTSKPTIKNIGVNTTGQCQSPEILCRKLILQSVSLCYASATSKRNLIIKTNVKETPVVQTGNCTLIESSGCVQWWDVLDKINEEQRQSAQQNHVTKESMLLAFRLLHKRCVPVGIFNKL